MNRIKSVSFYFIKHNNITENYDDFISIFMIRSHCVVVDGSIDMEQIAIKIKGEFKCSCFYSSQYFYLPNNENSLLDRDAHSV